MQLGTASRRNLTDHPYGHFEFDFDWHAGTRITLSSSRESEQTGIATNPAATAMSYRTLTWYFDPIAFTPGQKLEMDIDVDFGIGKSGDAMAGMVVTVVLRSGITLTGVVAVDPFTPKTASVALG